MHRRSLIVVCLAVVLVLASCVSQRPVYETAPVRIGFFADLSGATASASQNEPNALVRLIAR